MVWKIDRCYDSHTHLFASGLMQSGLKLFGLQKSEDISKLQIKPHHFRGEWLVGFGWDQSKWPDSKWPTKEILDQIFPDFPVVFSRADGHAAWINSKALEKIGLLDKNEEEMATPPGSTIIRDSKGLPTGVIAESIKIELEMMIPPYTKEQEIEFLRDGIRYFNSRGFSHVRDMSGTLHQWNLLRELDLKHELTVYVDENFTCENLLDFPRALREAQEARKSETPHLKARGIKFYFDGSLGSQGAFLSQFYPGTQNRGLTLWELEEVAVVLEETWKAGFEVCVHTIGDEAAHLILQTAHQVITEKGIQGPLNVEHAEILRPETIELMKNFNITCHLQPCHWLTDRKWLKETLGPLYENAFPWKALQQAGIQIQWGSDSPIEESSVPNNWKALRESPQAGIPSIEGPPLQFHSHRESNWGSHCHSIFENEKLQSFVFDGKEIFSSKS